MRKFLFGLAPLLALVAFALAPSAAVAHKHHRSAAVAQQRSKDGPCRILAAWTAAPAAGKCAPPPGVSTEEAQNLVEEEDGAGTTPISTSFPTNGMLVNTKSKLRFNATIGGTTFHNESPTGYSFFGVDLMSNPENSTTVCKAATGSVPFIDIQNGKPSAVMFTGVGQFTIISDSTACAEARRGLVIILSIEFKFEQLGVGKAPIIATGTFTGKYSQPNAEKCPAGGIEVANLQPGIVTEPVATSVSVDNGEEGKPALLCFVSANNYLFPKEAPKWEKFTNATGKEGIGIWKTAAP